MDLVTLESKEFRAKWDKTSSQFVGDAVWSNFDESVKTLMVFVEIPSKALLLKNLFKEQKNGWFLASLCVLPQILKSLLYTDILSGCKFTIHNPKAPAVASQLQRLIFYNHVPPFLAWFAYSINRNYIRLLAVGGIVSRGWLNEEVITSGVAKYLQKEYRKAADSLENTSRQEVHSISWEHWDLQILLERWLADIPLVRFSFGFSLYHN
jgi:hypothetical protein